VFVKSPFSWIASFRHWLVITTFTAFNIALQFIYRKRPEGQPCEV
jgi:hypothetical protein